MSGLRRRISASTESPPSPESNTSARGALSAAGSASSSAIRFRGASPPPPPARFMREHIRQSYARGKVTTRPLTRRERFGQGNTSRFRERSPALTATLLSETDFIAEPVERLDAPEPPTPAERRFHVVALIAAAVLHVLIPLSFFLYYWLWPRTIPTAVREIPVEVVVEQPPPLPKPKPPEEKPKPQPQPHLETPAYDAPAAPTKEKVNRESPDKTTEAKAA